MTSPESPLFDIPRTEWIASNRSAFAVWDAYPVSPGPAWVVARRQIREWWEATTEDRIDFMVLSMWCEPTSKSDTSLIGSASASSPARSPAKQSSRVFGDPPWSGRCCGQRAQGWTPTERRRRRCRRSAKAAETTDTAKMSGVSPRHRVPLERASGDMDHLTTGAAELAGEPSRVAVRLGDGFRRRGVICRWPLQRYQAGFKTPKYEEGISDVLA